MKKGRKRLLCVAGVVALVLAYCASYIAASRDGFYLPGGYGLYEGPDGTTIMAPKAALGYDWIPFQLRRLDDSRTPKSLIFAPLIALDRRLWHTSDSAEFGRYRIEQYLDFESMTNREWGTK